MSIRNIKDIQDLKGKKVLLRVDFNVPLKEDGTVQDDSRIRASLETINYLRENGAKIIIISHLGRPKGEIDETLRLDKVAEKLSELIMAGVKKLDQSIGEGIKNEIDKMENGSIVILENIRFHKEEKECEENFVKELSSLGDIFVNDAFGAAHRKHASTYGLALKLPSYAGFLMEKEVKALSPLLGNEIKKPLTMIFGGAKIDTKIGVIENFLEKADYIILGGGLANTFLAAQGKEVGASLYEEDKAELAQEIAAKCSEGKLILPSDLVLSKEISETAQSEITNTDHVINEMKILDMGPESSKRAAEIIAKSGTVIWNGPVGLYELTPFQNGSKTIAEAIANSNCQSIVGGGDTADCIKRFGIAEEKFTHVSTGGGACIEFLSGKSLPGVEALQD